MDTDFTFHPIGMIHSCFSEKFGIPRQPRLVTAAQAVLEVLPPFDRDEAFRGLDAFSHLWIVFIFHGIQKGRWQPTVRPPRLGGNRRIGVFATRSGFRPNPIGISAVVLDGVRRESGKLLLDVAGIDLLNHTPVLDIKPYLPYADAISDAIGGFADDLPRPSLSVKFTPDAKTAAARQEKRYPGFTDLVIQVLTYDPRPAYLSQHPTRTDYGICLYDVNVRWAYRQGTIIVLTIGDLPADAITSAHP